MFRTETLQARTAEAWCSGRGHYRPERPKPGVPGRGHYRTERPRPGVPDGDTTGPNGRGLVLPDGDITGLNVRGLVLPEGNTTGPIGRGLVFPCSRTGTLQAQIPRTVSGGLAPSAFHPSLEYSTGNVVLFCQPRPIFAVVAFVVRRRRRVIFLRGAVYDGRIGQAF